jgi:hypothetical protein
MMQGYVNENYEAIISVAVKLLIIWMNRKKNAGVEISLKDLDGVKSGVLARKHYCKWSGKN